MFKLQEKQSEERFIQWINLRNHLETSNDPLTEVSEFFQRLPKTKIYTDPYDQATWPTAWELINENIFCPFNRILGVCYTLQLCDKFNSVTATINISIDNETKIVYYLLNFNDMVYGFIDGWIPADQLPGSLSVVKSYTMPPI